MENTKPQWLIDAEKEIDEFHQTEIGNLSDKEFRKKEAKVNAAILSHAYAGDRIVNNLQEANERNGHLERLHNDPDFKKWASRGGKKGGLKSGKIAVESGQLKRVAFIGGKIQSNTLHVFSDGAIIKNANAKRIYLLKHPNVTCDKVVLPYDSDYSYYENIFIEQLNERTICKYCGIYRAPHLLGSHMNKCKHKPA
jgi:hypothetical protein